MNTQLNTAGGPILRMGDDVMQRIHELSQEARIMWRREPAATAPTHSRIMQDLAALRLDLEALERRRSRAEPHEEHERELHDCASRLERLRLHWRTVDA